MVQVGRNTNGTETLCQNSQWNTLEVSRYARLVKKKKMSAIRITWKPGI